MLKKNLFFFTLLLSYFALAQTNTQILNTSNNTPLEDVVYYCPGENFALKVNATATSTGSYMMTAVPSFSVRNGSQFVDFFDKAGNDRFSDPLDIGFEFDFFGTKYSKVVVGANGRLLFSNASDFLNLKDHTTFIDLIHSGNSTASTNVKIPSPEYNKVYRADANKTLNMAQIFAGYTDLHYTNTAAYNNITYSRTTYNGKAALLISFTDIIEVNNFTYSTQLSNQILLVSDNSYFIKIIKKSNVQNAIYGAQNETGTRAVWPVNNDATSVYNNGKWNVGSNPVSYSFTPSQNLTPEISWTNNGAVVSTNANYTFTPTLDTEDVKVSLLFKDDLGNIVIPSQTSSVKFQQIKPSVLLAPIVDTSTCSAPATLKIDNPNPSYQYDWFNVSNPTTPIGTNVTELKVGSGTYFVRIKNKNGVYCGASNNQVVTLTSSVPPFTHAKEKIYLCNNSSGSYAFNLLDLYGVGSNYDLEFIDGSNVYNAANGYVINIPSGVEKKINIKVTGEIGSAGCNIDDEFTLNYQSFPTNGQVLTTNKICSEVNRYTVGQFKIDFPQFVNYNVQFSTNGSTFNLAEINPQTNPSFDFKLSLANYTCSTVGKVNVAFSPTVIANQPTAQLEAQCGSATQTFDLNSLIAEINPSADVEVSFHGSLDDAKSGAAPVDKNYRSGMGENVLYIRVRDKITGCVATTFPTITLLVYPKPKIISANPIIKTNCEGNTQYNLTQNISDITDVTAPVQARLEYYSPANVLLSAAQISNYDAAAMGAKPYIKVIYNSTCSDVVTFDLKYNPKPKVSKIQIPVCNETTYSLSDFKNNIIANSSNYTFTYADGTALPTAFNLNNLPLNVSILIKETATGCISDPINITFVKGNPTVLTQTNVSATICDGDTNSFDGLKSVNLDSYKSQFSSDANASFKYFSDAGLTQLITSPYINTNSGSLLVYVQVSSVGFCPTVGTLNIKINVPTKSSTLLDKYYICYGDTVIVDAGTENVKFDWSDGTQTANGVHSFTQAGNYSVTLTNAEGCSYVHSFVISDENQPKISQINQTNDQIEVIASGGSGNYMYSFDGGYSWQNSNIYANPTAPEYTIQVRSVLSNGGYCLGPKKSIYSVTMSNVITPNGDGRNDFWAIKNLDKMEQVGIKVFDRFGKFVFESTSSEKTVWDGKINGRALPTDTYWYLVKWYDPSTLKSETRQGWILLKNRD